MGHGAPVALNFIFLILIFIFAGCGQGDRMPLSRIQGGAGPLDESGNINYRRDVLPIFKAKCASCHNATSPPKQPNWLDYKTAFAFKDEILKRIWVVRDMPPGRDLAEKNRATIAAWVKSGGVEGQAPLENTPLEENFPGVESSKTSAMEPGTKGQLGTDPISRGLYLTRAADCFSCHTSLAPQSIPGAGGRKMEIPYGILETPNITPDNETGIGRWTSDEFYQALHNGIGKNGEYLYPAFPFTSYTKMPREDVDLIFTYLKSLKPIHNKVNVNQLRFPFSIRLSLGVWRSLFFQPGTFVFDPGNTEQWNRGAYLVTGPGHCTECHSPRNFMGAVDRDKEFTGTEIDHWYASNLTYSARNGITDWSENDLVDFLGTGSVPGKATVVGPMAEIIFSSLQFLTLPDLKAIAHFLKLVSSPGFYNAKDLEVDFNFKQGQTLYSTFCMKCHQANGVGEFGVTPPLLQNPIASEEDPSNLINTIILGVPPRGNYQAMPSFAEKLDDQQIADVANYVRYHFGLTKPIVTRTFVSEKRAKLND